MEKKHFEKPCNVLQLGLCVNCGVNTSQPNCVIAYSLVVNSVANAIDAALSFSLVNENSTLPHKNKL